MLLGIVLFSIAVLLVLIIRFKMNPFIALLLCAVLVGLATGMPYDKLIASIQTGMGNTLGFIAIVLGLGTMLGKLMAESGAAEVIARTMIRTFGERNAHWAMMFVAFIVGIPVFFQVGLVLLIPILFTLAKEAKISLLKIGVPLVAGLSVVHGLVPPHPAAMAAVGIFKADIGLTILYSIIVGLPTAAVAGPIYGAFIGKRIVKAPPENLLAALESNKTEKIMPSFTTSVTTVLMPVFLMLLATFADIYLPKTHSVRLLADFVGSPIMALLISMVYGLFSFGYWRGFTKDTVLKFTNDALGPTATILMVIGAGGAFNKVLLDSGIGNYLAQMAMGSGLSPIILGWLIAALMRVATGSATVSMMTAAGLVAPVITPGSGISPELMVLATGAGSLIASHVNDSGFWLIKEYFGMTVQETLASWTVLETIIAVVALVLIMTIDLLIY